MSTDTKQESKATSKKRKAPSSNKGSTKKKKKQKTRDPTWYLDVLVYGNDDGDYPTVDFYDGDDPNVVYKKALAAEGKNIKTKNGKARVISKPYDTYEEREAAYLFGRCVEKFYQPGDTAKWKIELFRRDPPGEEEDYFNVEPCVDCGRFEKCEQVYCCGMEKFI